MVAREFNYKTHHYQVIPIEGNVNEVIIIRDGKKNVRVSKDYVDAPLRVIDELFKNR